MKDSIIKMYDAAENFIGVFVPAVHWSKIEKFFPESRKDEEPEDDMTGFNELLASWSFAYPYDPAVSCPVCGAESRDWRSDPARPFRLNTANIGGLLVFHCNNCGATIRHKYFRRHMSREYTV